MKAVVPTVKTSVVPLLSQVQQHELPRIQTELQVLCSSSSLPELGPHTAGGWDLVEGMKKKPKQNRHSCREYKGQGLSETGRVSQMPGRWRRSRGRNIGLKGYCELWGTAVSDGHQQPRTLRGKHWCACAGQVNRMWAMLCVRVSTNMGGRGTERSCNCYSWQRGEGPQEKSREVI